MAEGKKIVRWSKTAVTNVGTQLLAEYAAGRCLDITSAFGSVSTPGDNLFELEDLADGRSHPLTIESVTRTEGSVTVCVQVTSLKNAAPYKLERVGIYAATRDPGEPKPPDGAIVQGDQLLMVVEDEADENGSKGVTVPAETDQLYTFKLYVVLTITNQDRLEVSISAAGIATVGAIKEAVKEHNEDPDAHPGLTDAAFKTHRADQNAHPGLTARIRVLELTLNGKETILAPEGDPTTETVGEKGQHYINLDTGTEWECSGAKDGEYIWILVDYDSKNFKSMRDALKEAAETAAQAKEVADGAAKAIAAVQNTISVVPSQAGSLIFNGSTQLPSWNNLAMGMMDITYGEDRTPAEDYQGETDAGTYKAYVTPKADYTWGDKSRDEKEIPWTIQRAIIAAVPSVSGTLTYNGSAQAPAWQNYNPEKLDKEEVAQTNAGEHSTRFIPTKNYQWSGGDTSAKVVKWTIAKAANTISVAPSGAQSVDVGDTVVIQVTSNSDAQIAATADNPASVEVTVDAASKRVTIRGASQGSANVTITSAGSTNYVDANAVVGVNVRRKTPSLSINPSGNQSISIGGSKQIAVTTDSDGAVSARSSAPGVATASTSGKSATISGASVGSAVITISVAQTTKYNAASATVSVSVVKPTVANSTWDEIRAISDAGTAASYFAPGDTKSLTLNGTVGTLALNNLRVDAFILGINHNAAKEGGNRIHWAIGKISGVPVAICDSKYYTEVTDGTKTFSMNHWGQYNRGGWKGCDLRYDILGSTNNAPMGYGASPALSSHTGYDPTNYDIFNSPVANTLAAAFPKDVRKVLKTVTKYTDNFGYKGDSAGNVTASVDYFFLLSEHEVYGGSRTISNLYEKNYQMQYDYFKAGNSKQLHKHDERTTAVKSHLRSPHYDFIYYFAAMAATGGGVVDYSQADYSMGLFVGFVT